jgi:hypothetical protein
MPSQKQPSKTRTAAAVEEDDEVREYNLKIFTLAVTHLNAFSNEAI